MVLFVNKINTKFIDDITIINSPSGKWKVQSNISAMSNMAIDKCNDEVLQKKDTSELQTPLSTNKVKRKLFANISTAENHTSKIILY